jgi:hypothetical protein
MALENLQTNCLRVVTIEYLKSFVNNIQKSDGSTYVISTDYDDTYCPTYSQLTGGTIVPVRVVASHPKDDVDGIRVNRIHHGTGANYANNQLVNRYDLQVEYTRFSKTDIAIDKTELLGCGDTAHTSYLSEYTRTSNYMINESAPAAVSCTTAVTSTAVSASTGNNTCHVISSSPGYGSTSPCTAYTYTIGANNGQSSRSDTISGQTTFRGTVYGSRNTVTVTQGRCCSSMEYRINNLPGNVSNINSCTGTGTLTFSADCRCTDPMGSWSTYTNLNIVWSFYGGTNFVTFSSTGNKTTYTFSDNCTNAARIGTYIVQVSAKDDASVMRQGSITFTQNAGPCSNCDCGCDALNISGPVTP